MTASGNGGGERTVFMVSNRPTPKLSLCMIVKNEEGNLERCLKSVQEVVDEMAIAKYFF
jgi:hypothetical protein